MNSCGTDNEDDKKDESEVLHPSNSSGSRCMMSDQTVSSMCVCHENITDLWLNQFTMIMI